MAMNRAQKRMLQKQGALGADGETAASGRSARRPTPPAPAGAARRSGPRPVEFLREVRGELRKVAWPTRPEVINYSIIVLVAVVVLTSFIALVDYGVSEFVLKLYGE